MQKPETLIPSIRILPMSAKDESFLGKSIEETQQWIIENLSTRPYYFKSGINAQAGTLILFQFHAHIIGWAELEEIIQFDKTNDYGYSGGFIFNPETIAIFNPINTNVMKKIWREFKGFNQSKQYLDVGKYGELWNYVHRKEIMYVQMDKNYQESIERLIIDTSFTIDDQPKELTQKTLVNKKEKYTRSIITAKKAIMLANYKCEFDSNHSFFTSAITGENYVEAHHLIPLQHQNRYEYSLDVEANIVSLCCVCHKTLHHSVFKEKKPIIDKLYDLRIGRLRKCKIPVDRQELYQYYS